jgi:hypothetical protein
MSTPSLKKFTIEHLRGSVRPFSLPFEKGKNLTVVYGENGTGKSTICDAFEFLGKGRVGSLENRGLNKTTRYWHSLGKKPTDIGVTLETQDGAQCRASLVKSDVVAHPAANRPRVEVLRRGQILALVEATPANRYATISRFIDVTGVEASEGALRDLIKNLNSQRGEAVAVVEANQINIQQFWETAGRPSSDAFTWAGIEAKRDPLAADAELTALSKVQRAYERLMTYPPNLKSARDAVKAAGEALDLANKQVQDCLRLIAKDAGDVMTVLEAAQAYLSKHASPSACPLCESTDKLQGLEKRVSERIAAFSSLQAAQKQARASENEVKRTQIHFDTISNQAIKDIQSFETERTSFQWAEDIKMPSVPTPTELDKLEAWLKETTELPIAWKKSAAERQDRKQFIGTLKKALTTYEDNVKAQKDLDVLLPKLARALEIVEEERKAFTDTVLGKIANEVGRIYELVHPGEGLNKISLELDPNRRASLEIGASFCGESTPPQAYFSESHLDTLGLCVFLALAGLDGPENTILILDDVLASVDEPHVERLIEMLYTEAVKFRHCLITTHYRPWKHKLRWGWLKNGQCQFIELSKWSNQHGMTLIRSIPDAEQLRTLLVANPPAPQLVCAQAGVILEASLDFLTQLYQCAVPRRPGGLYTLGDLLQSVNSKLRKSLRAEVQFVDPATKTVSHLPVALGPILDELARVAQARNVFGCHFNAISFDLLESDAIGFGQKVLELIDALADPEAGWPRNSKSGSYWANSGETRRLHPLQQPS